MYVRNSHMLWNVLVHNCLHKSLPLVYIMSWTSSAHSLQPCLFKFILILSFHLCVCVFQVISCQVFVWILYAFLIPSKHVTCKVTLILLDFQHDNYIWGKNTNYEAPHCESFSSFWSLPPSYIGCSTEHTVLRYLPSVFLS